MTLIKFEMNAGTIRKFLLHLGLGMLFGITVIKSGLISWVSANANTALKIIAGLSFCLLGFFLGRIVYRIRK